VRKIVSLAMSCSINAGDVWEKTQINIRKGNFRERKEGKTNQAKINASEHGDLFYRGSVPKNIPYNGEIATL
jgi:hypothetical protein